MSELYYIWSFEHNAWWKPRSCGYTRNIKEAGQYPFGFAKNIVSLANEHCDGHPNEAMLPVFLDTEKPKEVGE